MKKILVIISFLFAAPAFAEDNLPPAKIGVIDMAKINKSAKVMKSLTKQREKAMESVQSDIEKKEKEFKKKEDELKAKQTVMSKEAWARDYQLFQREVMEASQNIQKRGEAVEKSFVGALRKLQDDYLDDIFKKIGKKHGFDMVVSSQAAVIINDDYDITDDVVEALNGKISDMKLDVK